MTKRKKDNIIYWISLAVGGPIGGFVFFWLNEWTGFGFLLVSLIVWPLWPLYVLVGGSFCAGFVFGMQSVLRYFSYTTEEAEEQRQFRAWNKNYDRENKE